MNQTDTKRKQLTILTYILGMITLILLSAGLGENGVAYMAAAVETYAVMHILTFAFLPQAMEKLIRTRAAKGQHKNAGRVFTGALFLALIAGLAVSLAMYGLSALWMEKVLLLPYGRFAFLLLLPAYFISAICAVLKGFFQGTGTAMPTVVAQTVKYIFLLTFALIFCYILGGYGKKAAVLLRNEDFYGMYAAGGAALGITLAVLLAFVFLFLVYMGAGRRMKSKSREGMRMTEDYSHILRLLVLSMLPPAGAACLLKLPELLGLFFFQRGQEDIYQGAYAYGMFYGKYEVWVYLAAALLLVGILPLTGSIAGSVKREEQKQTRDYLQMGFTWTAIWSLFLTAFFIAAAPGLLQAVYQDTAAAGMLQFCSPVIVLMALGAYFMFILWENGKIRNVLLVLLAALGGYIAVLIPCLKLNGGKIENLAYAQLVFYGIICFAGGFNVFRRHRLMPDWTRGLVFPATAAAVSGGIMWILAKVLMPAAGGLITTLVCLLVGVLCHLILVLVLKCARERDIALMPGGKLLVRAGKLLHLL